MALQGDYKEVVVESFIAPAGANHGGVHVRPVPGQPFPPSLRVECSRSLVRDYPVGTRFKIMAKLTDKEGEGQFLYSSYKWAFEVLK